MSVKKLAIALVSAPVLALIFIVAAAPAFSAVVVGDKAPDFTLGNISGNGSVKLSDYTSKPTLLVFWVSWCPHCQRELPIVQNIYRELGPKGMNAVGVSVDTDLADAKAFVEQRSLTFPNAFAGTDAGIGVIDTYQVRGVPAIYVIDKGGVVKAVYRGEIDAATIRSDLARLGVK